jgi:protein-disulfide isomerase
MRKIWFGLTGLVSLLGVSLGTVSAAPPQPTTDPRALLQITKDDRILGKPDAPITIVEYASLTCPHCAHFQAEVLPEIKKQWIDTGKAKLVLRDFPLDEEALRAAMIARCAPPARYYAFADTFFAAQDKWVRERDYQGALAKLARLGGMGKEEFDACLRNKQLEDSIVESRFVASKTLDVNSTPTFFINGNKFTGAPTAQDFAANLEAALPATTRAQPPATQAEPAATPATPSAPDTSTAAATQTAPATPEPKPSVTPAPPPAQAPQNVAQATPTPAPRTPEPPPATSADAGQPPETTMWERVRSWFQNLFGSHS